MVQPPRLYLMLAFGWSWAIWIPIAVLVGDLSALHYALAAVGAAGPSLAGVSPTRPELDSLIEEITVDCYDEDEQLQGFENAFDQDATFPSPGTVIGEHVEVLHVGQVNGRRELIATCQRHGRRYELALLDH